MTLPRISALAVLVLVPTASAAVAWPAGPASRPAADMRAAPRLIADPAVVQPGGTLRLEGTGFPRNAHVALTAGPPHAEATRIGGAETGRRGRFVATIHIRPRSSGGVFVARACDDGCHVKASARFRIVER